MAALTARLYRALSISGLALLAAALIAVPARAENHPFLPESSIISTNLGGESEDFCGAALGSSHELYVADYYHHTIDVYNAEFHPGLITQITQEDPLDGPCGLAIDNDPASPSYGDLYVNNYHRDVVRFTPSSYPPTESTTYGSETVIDSAHSTGLAVDPATGDVYVDDRTYVAEYGPSGALIQKIGEGSLKDGYGVAVSGFGATKGDVYVADASNNTVKVYEPSHSLTEPILTIDGAGTPQAGFTDLTDSNLAVDPSNGHLFVVDDTQPGFQAPAAVVDEFNRLGYYRGQLPHAIVDAEPSAVAIGESGGDVYVTSGNWAGASVYAFGGAAFDNTLEVSKSGAGKGAVTSEPAGINCGTACAAEFEAGSTVTLTALPDPHSTFSGWSGCEAPLASKCTETMSAAKSVKAEFAAIPQQTLTVITEGAAGSVTSSPEGIECGATCSEHFNEGSTVTLTAQPAPLGSAFNGWTVNGSPATCPGTATSCQVTISATTTVKADFATVAVHTLSLSRTGAGTVISEPPGISCGGACSAEYDQGSEVTLTATPEAHQTFSGFSGGGCSGTGACKVTLGADTTVSATFAPILHTLSVFDSGTGQGSISSSPAGISCGAACSARFEEGTAIALTATAAPGSIFTGWSGGGCTGLGACEATLGADTQVRADFFLVPVAPKEEAPPGKLTLGQAISGAGGAAVSIDAVLPGPGTITATGKGLKPSSVVSHSGGTTKLRLELSKAGKKALRRAKSHKLAVKVTFTFTPSGGAPTVATKTVTFKAKGARR